MSDGSQGRRTVVGLAWIVMGTALVAPGCAQIPVPRSNSNQVHIPPPDPMPLVATKKAAKAPGPTNKGGSLPPLPPDLVSASDPAAPAAPDSPTPLLDEALAKADAELPREATELPLDKEADPAGSPPSEPVAKAPPQPQTPEPQLGPGPDPKLVALHALADSKPAPVVIDPEKSVKPVDPGDLWSEGIGRLQRIASEQARASGTGAWTQRAHLLDIIAEDDPRSDEKSDQTRSYRMALVALGIPHEAVATDEPLRGAEIRAAVVALEGEAPLEISDLRLCRKVNGFGNFDPLDTAACKAGQPLIVYCEMSGLHYSPAGELFHSRLSSRVELVPSNGGQPVWAQSLGSAEDVCRRRRRDYYVNYRIVLAETIPPGVYELRLVQNDEVAGRSTSASIPLTIQR
jgi:hypothetical protein